MNNHPQLGPGEEYYKVKLVVGKLYFCGSIRGTKEKEQLPTSGVGGNVEHPVLLPPQVFLPPLVPHTVPNPTSKSSANTTITSTATLTSPRLTS